jgi:biotin carboxyl carrier protein
VLCSGKVAFDLIEARDAAGITDTQIIRIEQIYPFPGEPLARVWPRCQPGRVVWCQEEPKNNGSWFFVEPLIEEALKPPTPTGRARYAGRRFGLARHGSAKRHTPNRARWLPMRWPVGPRKSAVSRRLTRARSSPPALILPSERSEAHHVHEVKVPTLGESVSEATIGQWLKKPGETVALDEPIASLETDKVAVEVPSPVAGVLGAQLFAEGETVTVGAVIATIEAGGAAAAPAPAAAAAPAPAAAAPVTRWPPPARRCREQRSGRAEPAVRRAVLEYGIDPATIKGTGKDGRITKEDVVAAAQAKAASPAAAAVSAPVAAPSNERREERVKMTRLRQTIAKRLKSAQETAALLTTFNDVDMSAVMEARNKYKDSFEKKHGVKLGFMSFFAKASCLALKDIPGVNAQIQGDEIVYHDYVDISVAVSAPSAWSCRWCAMSTRCRSPASKRRSPTTARRPAKAR